MKIIITSLRGDGFWFSLRLLREGHKVDLYLKDKRYKNVLRGIVPSLLEKEPDYSKYDLSIFDLTGLQGLAEKSARVCPTIGDSNFATQIEDDRLFGMQFMEYCGINIPKYEAFTSFDAARQYILENKKKYVFKADGDQSSDVTYVSKSPEDMLEYMDALGDKIKGADRFILQEVVSGGTEVSMEGWFDGTEFSSINVTLEEKKFLNNNLGPNTGCAGNIMFFPQVQRCQLFNEGLGKTEGYLRDIGFHGMIDLNTIVTEDKVFGLEWTPRFGYDASATVFHLIKSDLGEFFYKYASGKPEHVEVQTGRFAAAIRLSIPPYPFESDDFDIYQEGVPIKGVEEEDLVDFNLHDAMLNDDDKLVTCGRGYGLIGMPIRGAESIERAFELCYNKIDKLEIPNLQYRTDLACCISKRYNTLEKQGWFS